MTPNHTPVLKISETISQELNPTDKKANSIANKKYLMVLLF
jgi:hypothetical protein